ncbi:glycosyltransferase family 2 protein [Ruoffia tabacinasalis]|uniref:glycosyltransferase family 2 protein n=1 Tax=Ruoffia tabacinasalis TaxID=87458 RepID=UPI003F9E544B
MRKPLISVIVPCYNSEKWVLESLESVNKQTYKNFEIIVVDDGSYDNTKDIVKNYDSSIVYKYQQNKGPAAARNLGVSVAKGQYIAFLDSDDLWENNKLEKQLSYIQSNEETDLILTDVTVVNEKNEFLFYHYNSVPLNKHELIIELFLGNIGMNTPTIFMKKEVFNKVGGFTESLPLREDHFFLMEISATFNIAHMKEHLVRRRVRASSLSHSVDPNQILKMNLPFIDLSLKQFPFLSTYKKQVYSKLYTSIGKKFWSNKDFINSRIYFTKAIKCSPKHIKNYIFLSLVLLKKDYSDFYGYVIKIRNKF